MHGAEFKIVTDHKPLEAIFNNPRSKPNARMLEITAIPRPCDLLAWQMQSVRLSITASQSDYSTSEETRRIDREYVDFTIHHACPVAITLDEVKEETAKDNHIKKIMHARTTENWKHVSKDKDPESRSFYNVHDELTVSRDRAVQLAHGGHQGIVRTKQLIPEKLWFPGIDS